MTTKSRLICAAAALAASVGLAGAQTMQDHSAHHPIAPDATQAPVSPPSPSGPGKPDAMAMQRGGMGSGMMGQGMNGPEMKGQGMKGPGVKGQGMKPEMGGGMMSGHDMMKMMAMMETMRGGMAPDGMGSPGMRSFGMGLPGMEAGRHVEGRIAFYKAELKIGDAQAIQWDAFADTLRGIAAKRQATMPSAGSATTAPEQLERGVAALSDRLNALNSVLTAIKPLYAVLSDDQKKIADDLMAERTMGMQPHATRMP